MSSSSKALSRRLPTSVENLTIAAEIRTQLLNEALKLQQQAEAQGKRLSQLLDDYKRAAAFPFSKEQEIDGETLDEELEALLNHVQGELSAIEQVVSQTTAAVVEFRMRRKTVLKVLQRFVGRSEVPAEQARRNLEHGGVYPAVPAKR